jgi:hypothetical protein
MIERLKGCMGRNVREVDVPGVGKKGALRAFYW